MAGRDATRAADGRRPRVRQEMDSPPESRQDAGLPRKLASADDSSDEK